MTTRSNLHYSVNAESLQHSLADSLQNSARAPLTTPDHSAQSTSSTAAPGFNIPSSLILQTPLEQIFIPLKECSKTAFLLRHPNFLNYQNQGGSRTLPYPYCMDTPVQETFLLLLPQFDSSQIQQFLSTSSADIFS